MIEINKIYNIECLSFMKVIPNDYMTITITSPPYNMGDRVKDEAQTYTYNNKDNLDFNEYKLFIKEVISELIRVTKYHVFFNIQEVNNNKGIISFIYQEFNNHIKEVFIWAKRNPPSHIVQTQCSNGYEYIFCFSKDNPEYKKFNYCFFNNRNGDYMKNIIINNVNNENFGHNYAFPKWLPNFFIKNFSQKGDLIFDCFMGSGTTAIVSKELNRNFIGCEISKDYCDIANKRLQQENLFTILETNNGS